MNWRALRSVKRFGPIVLSKDYPRHTLLLYTADVERGCSGRIGFIQVMFSALGLFSSGYPI